MVESPGYWRNCLLETATECMQSGLEVCIFGTPSVTHSRYGCVEYLLKLIELADFRYVIVCNLASSSKLRISLTLCAKQEAASRRIGSDCFYMLKRRSVNCIGHAIDSNNLSYHVVMMLLASSQA